jgi:hypothetical protein
MEIERRSKVENRRRSQRKPLLSRLFVGALFWLAARILEPVPVLGALVDIMAFAV